MTDKPKRPRRAKKPLGSHPLGTTRQMPCAKSQTLGDILIESGVLPKPFYQTPPGGEPTIPHEPPRMTREGRADAYAIGGSFWSCSGHYGDLGGGPIYSWERARALGLLDERL